MQAENAAIAQRPCSAATPHESHVYWLGGNAEEAGRSYRCPGVPAPSAASRPRFNRLRDPKGWLLDKLPWPLRRLYLSVQYREWVPNGARYISLRRPPWEAFEIGRQLARESNDPTVRAAIREWDEQHG